jgi:hypothetical protein
MGERNAGIVGVPVDPATGHPPHRFGQANSSDLEKAANWHVSDGTASDGSGRPLRSADRRHSNPIIGCRSWASRAGVLKSGERGALLCCEGLYLARRAMGRGDAGPGGPSHFEVARLRTENERPRTKLVQPESAVIDVQGKCARSRKRSPTAGTQRSSRRRREALTSLIRPRGVVIAIPTLQMSLGGASALGCRLNARRLRLPLLRSANL